MKSWGFLLQRGLVCLLTPNFPWCIMRKKVGYIHGLKQYLVEPKKSVIEVIE